MSGWSVIIVLCIIIIWIIWYIRISAEIRYYLTSTDERLVCKIFLLRNMMIYKVEMKGVFKQILPYLKKEINTVIKRVEPEVEQENSELLPKLGQLSGHPKGLKKIFSLVDFDIQNVRTIMRKILKVINYEKLYITIKYGSGDAASTAIMIGNLWFLSGLITLKFQKSFCLHNTRISCIPSYGDKCMEVDFLCIFNMRLRDIINMRKLFLNKR